MISILIIFSLLFLPNLIHSSITFTPNPDCNVKQCKDSDQEAFYYANHTIGDKTDHMIFSSFDELSISIFQAAKTSIPTFDYTQLYGEKKNYTDAIKFDGTGPTNSFTLVIRRIIEFNDTNDKGIMPDYLDPNITTSYFLTNLTRNNISLENTNQPSFQYRIDELDGLLTVDINYPGESIRDSKFPKLKTEPSSYFLNIALKANIYSYKNSRFTFELFFIAPGKEGYSTKKTRFIDDQYTPGSFNVWQLNSLEESLHPSSMLWKPVVYLTEDRSIEDNTLMQIKKIQNNVIRDETIDQGIYLSLLPQPYISALNVSIGAYGDGFFKKENFGFLQFTAGLDKLEPDQTGHFVTVAVIVSFALPLIVGIIAAIFILKRKISGESSNVTYREIND